MSTYLTNLTLMKLDGVIHMTGMLVSVVMIYVSGWKQSWMTFYKKDLFLTEAGRRWLAP